MKIATLQFNPFGENTYVIYGASKECIIVDAGCYSDKEQNTLAAFIEKNELRPIMALNTHAHVDHVCGVDFVMRKWGIPFALHSADTTILEMVPCYADSMGFDVKQVPPATIDLSQTTQIMLGDTQLNIIHTPGHTPGHISIHIPEQQILLTGDTLFKESIGRTDLPGGDYQSIMESIIERIIPLGNDTRILPGHGPQSTIAHEVMFNPFVSEALQKDVNYKTRNEN